MFTLLVKTFQSGKGIDKIITPLAIILYILCELLLTVYLVDLFIIMIFNFIGQVIKMKDESKHRKIFTFTITGLIEDKTNHQKVQAKLIVSFIVLFLILQQIEGNVIYPRVVGNSVGLPAIWVLVAITVGGNMMGILGMIIFIPICSVVYTLLKETVNHRIAQRKIKIDQV